MSDEKATLNPEKGLQLVQASESFKDGVSQLRVLTEAVPSMPTADLGKGYALIKAFDSEYKDLVETIRNEFIGTQKEDGTYNKDGRIFLESTGEDDKGNKELLLPDNTMLKASKSQKVVFDAEKAKEVLAKHKLTADGSDTIITVVDPEGLYTLLGEIMRFVPATEHNDLITRMMSMFNKEVVPNKDKIEALMVLKKLPTDEVNNLMTTKDTYSLLVSKNPYKPKKKK